MLQRRGSRLHHPRAGATVCLLHLFSRTSILLHELFFGTANGFGFVARLNAAIHGTFLSGIHEGNVGCTVYASGHLTTNWASDWLTAMTHRLKFFEVTVVITFVFVKRHNCRVLKKKIPPARRACRGNQCRSKTN